jgi:hypothetical protein
MVGHRDREPSVLIAGDGIAASALACLLLDSDIGVIIAAPVRRQHRVPIIEALPQAAVHLVDEIGVGSALTAAQPICVRGFVNAYHGEVARLDGMWTHVDRGELARQCLTTARRRGATVIRADEFIPPRPFAFVDASGRAARWSRPVRRAFPSVAAVFSGPPAHRTRPGLIARIDDGWLYRLDHPLASTVGVISTNSPPRGLTEAVAARADIDDSPQFRRAAVRSGAVQWSVEPVKHRQLAIGDAALAMSPMAGQGVRFALSSALAAAAVIRTWTTDDNDTHAAAYYRSFVDGVRTRHLTALRDMSDPDPSAARAEQQRTVALDPECQLSFIATSTVAGQNRGGRIVADECFILPDGGLVRSIGGVDLTWLRDMTRNRPDFADVCAALTTAGVGAESAATIIAWAIKNGVLAAQSRP